MRTPENPGSGAYGEGSQMPEPVRRGERLLGLLIWGLMFLNFPLLSIFSVSAFFWGIPVLYIYLFSVWFLILAVTAFVMRGSSTLTEKSSDSQDIREP